MRACHKCQKKIKTLLFAAVNTAGCERGLESFCVTQGCAEIDNYNGPVCAKLAAKRFLRCVLHCSEMYKY